MLLSAFGAICPTRGTARLRRRRHVRPSRLPKKVRCPHCGQRVFSAHYTHKHIDKIGISGYPFISCRVRREKNGISADASACLYAVQHTISGPAAEITKPDNSYFEFRSIIFSAGFTRNFSKFLLFSVPGKGNSQLIHILNQSDFHSIFPFAENLHYTDSVQLLQSAASRIQPARRVKA